MVRDCIPAGVCYVEGDGDDSPVNVCRKILSTEEAVMYADSVPMYDKKVVGPIRFEYCPVVGQAAR